MTPDDASLTRRYAELQWRTAEAMALLDDPEPGVDVDEVRARLERDLTEFTVVRAQYYAARGLALPDSGTP